MSLVGYECLCHVVSGYSPLGIVNSSTDGGALTMICGGKLFGTGHTYFPDVASILFSPKSTADASSTTSTSRVEESSMGLFSGLNIGGSSASSTHAAKLLHSTSKSYILDFFDNTNFMELSELEIGVGRGDMWNWQGLATVGKTAVPPPALETRRSSIGDFRTNSMEFRTIQRISEKAELVDLTMVGVSCVVV